MTEQRPLCLLPKQAHELQPKIDGANLLPPQNQGGAGRGFPVCPAPVWPPGHAEAGRRPCSCPQLEQGVCEATSDSDRHGLARKKLPELHKSEIRVNREGPIISCLVSYKRTGDKKTEATGTPCSAWHSHPFRSRKGAQFPGVAEHCTWVQATTTGMQDSETRLEP